ncbi:MAG: PIG-L family deacetylase [Candidatus Thorarchaeota archaeon]|nr:PIG-L family deacetylase [Candidatus Thorarchaeota archaeon]NIW14423.1 PIG-L family deacetylase [Candidatus Thorarchaeota archaeon]NIW52487.1 PIG-L family deacetylase [Candidatus Korarchaeota archaeon]
MRALIISAHTDDAIITTGGTISRMVEEGGEIFYVGLSIAEESVPEGFPKDAVEKECQLSTEVLGIDPKKVYIERFPVRRFPESRQKVLDTIINFRDKIRPDMAFIPTTTDIHQDHEVVNRESIRALRSHCSIYGYDFPWNSLSEGKLNLFYQLEERHIRKKVKALSCFKSQIVKKTGYLTEEYVRSLAIERGNRIGTRYAEAFEVIRDIRRKLNEEVPRC